MSSIVLVPGAWLGGWAWQEVVEPLVAAGHDVHPATLTGLAGDGTGSAADLDTHTEDLVRLIVDRDLSGVVLVAHSYGGFPVTGAAERIPDRIARVVYVDSGPPPDGACQLEMMTEPPEQQRLRDQVQGGRLPPRPWDPAQDPVTLAGLDGAALARLHERATGHPFGSWSQRIRRRPGGLAMPVALISCLFPLDQLRAMIASGHPDFAELAGAELRALPTGHWPMFSEPERLAGLIDELATPLATP